MNKRISIIILSVCFAVSVSSCKVITLERTEPKLSLDTNPSPDHNYNRSKVDLPEIPLSSRLAWPENEMIAPAQTSERLYSFLAQNLPVDQALRIFAKAYGLNIIVANDVSGVLNTQFYDLPFNQAMEALLDSLGLYWIRNENLIEVKSWETRNFTVNYIRLIRSGAGSAEAKVSSGSGENSEDNGENGSEAGAITITQEDTVEFWSELQSQLDNLISDEGRIIINRLSGTIQVSDYHPRVVEVSRFINQINHAIHRQVDIEVKIFEVSLNDDFSLGVDWSRVANNGEGNNISYDTSNSISQPYGGFPARIPSVALSILNIKDGIQSIGAVVEALREQGDVKAVSQPKIRTLNNQAAMIKVGTDKTFFRRSVSTDSTSAGSTTTIQDVPQVVTEGVTFAITPQISTDGWIMMDVSPVVTRVSSISTIMDSNGNIRSSAPNLDIRQTSSLIRSRSGETVVIGGLIQDQESETKRSVPILGDIPILGKLFQGTYTAKVKRELVMFVTAKLVNTNSQISLNDWESQQR